MRQLRKALWGDEYAAADYYILFAVLKPYVVLLLTSMPFFVIHIPSTPFQYYGEILFPLL